MKGKLLLVGLVILCTSGISSAQGIGTWVLQTKHDTLVVKDYNDMGGVANSIANLLNADTGSTVPADRVYELHANGYYPITANPTTAARGVVIVGEDSGGVRLVNNTDANAAPPVLCGSTISGAGSNTGGINWGGNLEVDNCNIIPSASDGTNGWTFFWGSVPNCTVKLVNDLFERTLWVQVASNTEAGTNLHINDCYFVNLSGLATRRNGGVYDNTNNNTDTIWVENCTHVMTEGSMYKFRNFPITKLFFNHNTFINNCGSVFENVGYCSNLTVANNIFVNCNLQSTSDVLLRVDIGEPDLTEPTGLINVNVLPDSFAQVQRYVLADRNLVYWDPRFNNVDSILIANKVDKTTNWWSQRIEMNTRTDSMFNDKKDYPYLTQGRWYNQLPTFAKPQNLLTSEVDSCKAWSVATVDTANTKILSTWRLVNIGADYYVYSDWPIPVNLAYTDASLMTAGTNGSPLGDLNWFPAQKAQWVASGAAAEHQVLSQELTSGVLAVRNNVTVPGSFALNQNYPNPFNPSTVINFTVPKAGNVTLKVYNVLGQEVATIVDGFKAAQTYNVKFDASNLSTGVYFYTLRSGDQSITKKMLLLK
jgi:hypothetical protein